MKKKNQGFSLVELIVTVAILAVVVAPLLNAFVVSTRTNVKAKEKMRCTTIAQNIMEGIEKMSLEELAFQFNYSDRRFNVIPSTSLSTVPVENNGATAYVLPVFELTKNGSSFQKVLKYQDISNLENVSNWQDLITSSILCKDVSKPDEYEFLGHKAREYYFLIQNISAGGKKYTSLITVKPNNEVKSSDPSKPANDVDMAQLQRINVATDGIAFDRNTPDSALALFPTTETTIPPENAGVQFEPYIKATDIKREIFINVKKVSDSTVAEVVYNFKARGNNNIEYEYEVKDPTFDNSGDTSNELKHLYLLYYPWYPHRSSGNPEKITINNPDNVDFTLHLIKQDTTYWGATDLLNTSHDALEQAYCVELYVNEGGKNANGTAHCDIQTNLDYNIIGKRAKVQVIGGKYGNSIPTVEDLKKIVQMRGLTVSSTNWDRIYDVTVNVYDNEVSLDTLSITEPLATFTGGMTN